MIQDVGRATVIQTGTKKLPFVTVRLQPCVDIWLAGCVIRLNRGGRDCTPQDYAVIATSVSVSAEQRNWFARGVDVIPDTPVRAIVARGPALPHVSVSLFATVSIGWGVGREGAATTLSLTVVRS